MTQFQPQQWRSQLKVAEGANWKKYIYQIMRPIWDKFARRHLEGTFIERFTPEMVIGERGFPLVSRQQWAFNGANLEGKSILVMGTGTGWDVASWAKYKPSKIIGVDLYEFSSWPEVKEYCASNFGVSIEMRAQSLTDMNFLEDECFDLIVSDAVLEHVTDLKGLMSEAYRLLKPTGKFYASYGPLWYCAGGDHFSGRGGVQNAYSHLLLSTDRYSNYLRENSCEIEDFQSGLRYVELGLFSKLRTAEYLETFSNAGFIIDSLIIEISQEALIFRKSYPALMDQLIKKYPFCDLDDFMVKANFIRLHKADESKFLD